MILYYVILPVTSSSIIQYQAYASNIQKPKWGFLYSIRETKQNK